ncbi:RNA-binding protein with serine-rich domain 1-A [Colletotrichum higginsianum]|nr:RNA-binding protein with serine-rich domain 1-A [Colletotrichum higginsianum]
MAGKKVAILRLPFLDFQSPVFMPIRNFEPKIHLNINSNSNTYENGFRIEIAFARPLPLPHPIVVERLTKNINVDHLEEIFGQYGRIKDLHLPINGTLGTNRGTAYILYETEADAEEAIAHMHEAQLDGTHLPRPVVAEASTPEALPQEVVVVEAGEGEGLALSATTALDEARRPRLVDSVPDQTHTGLVRRRVLRLDPLVPLRRPGVVEADIEAVPDPTPDLLHHPRDVAAVVEVTTVTAGEGARAETATIATTAVDPGLQANPATVAVAEAAADTDEREV